MTVTIEINDELKGVIMLEMLTSLLGALAVIITFWAQFFQRPISANPGLNFNPSFFISLFKSL